jgi:hypothetical protein
VCAAATAAHGQIRGSQRIEMAERDNRVRENEMERSRKRDPNEVMAEVNDDLRQLNQLNDAIAMHTATPNQAFNYDSVVGKAAEIKKRSIRLRTDLALPKSDGKEKLPDFKDAEQGELKPSLSQLNQLLDSFLHNPIFGDTGEIDMHLAAKARRDLESIIILSEKVRKNAEKQSKSSNKAQ